TPLFQIAAFGQGGGFGGGQQGAAGRPSGRGSESDPDIVQGRRPPESPVSGCTPPVDPNAAAQIPPLAIRPRIVLQFAPEKELLVSGMLAGGSELAGKAAVVDVPVGKGHVVMFANNPMWRHQTHGSFSLLFNAILNYDNLGVGRTEAAPRPPRAGEDDEAEQ
ncbi:MAG TPA: hypothetical protein VK612_02310, partial [Pyrinomonadaceae bacterium]|nr:hypothetical protein [Pyrinomonadaceae bacterium]